MSNWVRNDITINGPDDEIARFVDAVTCKGKCDQRCAERKMPICLHELARIGMPNWKQEPNTELAYVLVDAEPWDATRRTYQVYSAEYSIAKLLILASAQFPRLKFAYMQWDISAGHACYHTMYFMTICAGIATDIVATISSPPPRGSDAIPIPRVSQFTPTADGSDGYWADEHGGRLAPVVTKRRFASLDEMFADEHHVEKDRWTEPFLRWIPPRFRVPADAPESRDGGGPLELRMYDPANVVDNNGWRTADKYSWVRTGDDTVRIEYHWAEYERDGKLAQDDRHLDLRRSPGRDEWGCACDRWERMNSTDMPEVDEIVAEAWTEYAHRKMFDAKRREPAVVADSDELRSAT